jgi:hypothetical protein
LICRFIYHVSCTSMAIDFCFLSFYFSSSLYGNRLMKNDWQTIASHCFARYIFTLLYNRQDNKNVRKWLKDKVDSSNLDEEFSTGDPIPIVKGQCFHFSFSNQSRRFSCSSLS